MNWLIYEEYLVHKELERLKHISAMDELKKYYTEKDNQFFLGYIDFINKNKL